jgi:hypothetical protein
MVVIPTLNGAINKMQPVKGSRNEVQHCGKEAKLATEETSSHRKEELSSKTPIFPTVFSSSALMPPLVLHVELPYIRGLC